MCAHIQLLLNYYYFRAGKNVIQKKHVSYNLLQESVGHWSQGLKTSMQDPKMQVAGVMLTDLKHGWVFDCMIFSPSLAVKYHCFDFF